MCMDGEREREGRREGCVWMVRERERGKEGGLCMDGEREREGGREGQRKRCQWRSFNSLRHFWKDLRIHYDTTPTIQTLTSGAKWAWCR